MEKLIKICILLALTGIAAIITNGMLDGNSRAPLHVAGAVMFGLGTLVGVLSLVYAICNSDK